MADQQTCEVGSTLAPLAVVMYGYRFSENTKTMEKILCIT
jgi:hypothetical protein